MSRPKIISPEGRADLLVQEMLKVGLKRHGSPGLRIAAKMAEKQIGQALTETFGPNTPAGKIAKEIVEGAGEFRRKFLEAQAQIQAEDEGR